MDKNDLNIDIKNKNSIANRWSAEPTEISIFLILTPKLISIKYY